MEWLEFVLNRTSREIDVVWTKLSKWQEPKDKVLDLLQSGKLADALPLIWTLVKKDPNDTDNLYHLGVVYSELKEYAKASEVLERQIDIDSEHVHGLTALGVAEIQQGNLLIGEECLGKALKIDPRNRWALRNLERA